MLGSTTGITGHSFHADGSGVGDRRVEVVKAVEDGNGVMGEIGFDLRVAVAKGAAVGGT